MEKVEMTQEFLLETFEYSDGKLYWKTKRGNKINSGDLAGTNYKNEYNLITFYKKKYKTHRLIFLYHHGYLPKFIDHKNGDRTNNRIENLRECTLSENGLNCKISKNNTSGVKGVRWKKDKNKWVAYVYYNGKQKFVGYFDNINDAKIAIEKFRELHHGEFANNG